MTNRNMIQDAILRGIQALRGERADRLRLFYADAEDPDGPILNLHCSVRQLRGDPRPGDLIHLHWNGSGVKRVECYGRAMPRHASYCRRGKSSGDRNPARARIKELKRSVPAQPPDSNAIYV